MDDPVSGRPLALALACCAVLGAAFGMPVHAQVLNDPTRPPANLMAPQTGPVVSAAPQLQSVLIARHPGGRHVAVIDGHTLRLGDKYRGAVLERVSEGEVVLRKGTQRQVLKLYAAASAAASKSAGQAE